MIADRWEDELTRRIDDLLPGHSLEFWQYAGQPFISCPIDSVLPLIEALKNSCGYDYLVDITAVDYPKRELRFDLIYILYSYATNHRLRIKTAVGVTQQPLTATSLFLAVNWLEREVYDMFGIEFSGHPNLKRILMPEEWTGFPLRKDYSILQQDQAWVQKNLGIESGQ